MLFTNFLASPWRWVVLALAILLAIAFGSQSLDYASTWPPRGRRAGRVVARCRAGPRRPRHR